MISIRANIAAPLLFLLATSVIAAQTAKIVKPGVKGVHGELLNWAKMTVFFGFATMPGMGEFVILFIHLIVVPYPARPYVLV